MNRLRRFLSPQLVDLVIDSGDEAFLDSHRREIVVVFCDLRGFTPFAEASEPEEVMGVLAEYLAALGELIYRFEGTLERFTGDGLMVFFNDPLPCDDAGRSARWRWRSPCATGSPSWQTGWSRRGHDLGFGIGIAQGFATLGRIGFEGRFDYAAIGSVTNLAARLCARGGPGRRSSWRSGCSRPPRASPSGEPVGELDLQGFSRPVRAFDVKGIDETGMDEDEGEGGHMTTLQSTDAPGTP